MSRRSYLSTASLCYECFPFERTPVEALQPAISAQLSVLNQAPATGSGPSALSLTKPLPQGLDPVLCSLSLTKPLPQGLDPVLCALHCCGEPRASRKGRWRIQNGVQRNGGGEWKCSLTEKERERDRERVETKEKDRELFSFPLLNKNTWESRWLWQLCCWMGGSQVCVSMGGG